MREESVDCVALRALDVHEVGVGRLNQALQLVEFFFLHRVHVQEIDVHSILFKSNILNNNRREIKNLIHCQSTVFKN